MAFLNETGLETFKKKCDAAYIKANGGASTQTVTMSATTTLGLKTTGTNAYLASSTLTYGPCLQMYDKNGAQCGQIMHSFRGDSDKNSKLAFYSQNQYNGAVCAGGMTIDRKNNTSSDVDGTTYWFSSKPNARVAIGIFSGTTAPGNDTARAGGDIYIQY